MTILFGYQFWSNYGSRNNGFQQTESNANQYMVPNLTNMFLGVGITILVGSVVLMAILVR